MFYPLFGRRRKKKRLDFTIILLLFDEELEEMVGLCWRGEWSRVRSSRGETEFEEKEMIEEIGREEN